MIRKVYLDTCFVIYLLEDVPVFSEQIRKYMAINRDAILCVSPLVRLEALVKPTIDGNIALIADYEFFLADQLWLTVGDVEFDRALALRACHKIKTQMHCIWRQLYCMIALNSGQMMSDCDRHGR